jgi:hypothetical protein
LHHSLHHLHPYLVLILHLHPEAGPAHDDTAGWDAHLELRPGRGGRPDDILGTAGLLLNHHLPPRRQKRPALEMGQLQLRAGVHLDEAAIKEGDLGAPLCHAQATAGWQGFRRRKRAPRHRFLAFHLHQRHCALGHCRRHDRRTLFPQRIHPHDR